MRSPVSSSNDELASDDVVDVEDDVDVVELDPDPSSAVPLPSPGPSPPTRGPHAISIHAIRARILPTIRPRGCREPGARESVGRGVQTKILFASLMLACGGAPSSDGGGDAEGGTASSSAGDPSSSGGSSSSGSSGGPSASTSTSSASSSESGSSDDGGPPVGFDPDEGFDVEGDFVHGGTVTIRRDAGGFGEREHAEPWLFDRVSEQFIAGEEQGAYAGLSDGDPIDTSIWTDQSYYEGWDGPEHKFKLTTDAARLRHDRVDAHYGNFAAAPTDPKPYSKLAFPVWPRSWGAQTNTQMYLSWWQRMDGAMPGYPQDADGNGGEDKPLRFGDTDLAGLTATTVGFGNVKSWGSFPDPGAAWHRVEIFIDRDQGIADMWVDGRLSIGTSWTVRPDDGGAFEFRPSEDYLWVEPSSEGAQLDTASWQNVTVHFLGFDDGGVTQMFAPGRNVELSEIYLDTTCARVEIANTEVWEDRPDAERTSEVSGRLLAWSDAEITVELDQGAFESLASHYLWVITPDGTPLRVGRFT